MARNLKRPVGSCSRMDEAYIKVEGIWKYLYRAVDKQRKTVDLLLTAKRDIATAKHFFDEAMGGNGNPDKVPMDKRGANKAAIDAIKAVRRVAILDTPSQIPQQYRRAGLSRDQAHDQADAHLQIVPVCGSLLTRIDLMHMIWKGQFDPDEVAPTSFAVQFYAFAVQVRQVSAWVMLSNATVAPRAKKVKCCKPSTMELINFRHLARLSSTANYRRREKFFASKLASKIKIEISKHQYPCGFQAIIVVHLSPPRFKKKPPGQR